MTIGMMIGGFDDLRGRFVGKLFRLDCQNDCIYRMIIEVIAVIAVNDCNV